MMSKIKYGGGVYCWVFVCLKWVVVTKVFYVRLNITRNQKPIKHTQKIKGKNLKHRTIESHQITKTLWKERICKSTIKQLTK
jgi:hypothetical protein